MTGIPPEVPKTRMFDRRSPGLPTRAMVMGGLAGVPAPMAGGFKLRQSAAEAGLGTDQEAAKLRQRIAATAPGPGRE